MTKINFNKCPTCQARLIGISVDHQHSNGQWNETAKFECGAIYQFSPNSGVIEINTDCPKSLQKITFNLLLKVGIDCGPKIDLDEVSIIPRDPWWWKHAQLFELPRNCYITEAKLIKKVKQTQPIKK